MKKRLFYYSLILITPFCNLVQAGSNVAGPIDHYLINLNDRFFFKVTGTVASKPACNTTSRYVVSLTTDWGKGLKDAVINAKSNGLTLTVIGAGTCTTWGDSEDVSYAYINGIPYGAIPPVVPKTVALCAESTTAECSCGGGSRQILKQVNPDGGLCAAKAEVGSCSAQGGLSLPIKKSSCCVCAP